MELSCCIKSTYEDRFPIAKELGYTAVEPNLTILHEGGEEKTRIFKEKMDSLGFTIPSMNSMFPGSLRFYGDEFHEKEWVEYTEEAFYLAALLGTPLLTLGSADARKIPEGMERARAEEEFRNVLVKTILPIAKKNGIRIAIEPLQKKETNFLNNCREILSFIEKTDEKIYITLDEYHSYLGGDTNEDIASCKDKIIHTHIAGLKDRAYPQDEDIEDLKGFFDTLKKIGYQGAVSVEGHTPADFRKEAATAIETIRKALGE